MPSTLETLRRRPRGLDSQFDAEESFSRRDAHASLRCAATAYASIYDTPHGDARTDFAGML